MELFFPSLIVLLLSALVCFFIIPRASPFVLGILCMAMLVLGLWQHYTMFPYEYRNLEFKDYSGYIFLIGIIFIGLIAISLLTNDAFFTNSINTTESSILPEMKMPTLFSGANSKSTTNQSSITSSISTVGENLSKTVSQIAEAASNTLSSLSTQVSGLMKTPVSTNLASGSFKVT